MDPEAAKRSAFGELIASGWHTASLTKRLLIDHYVFGVAKLGAPGVDQVGWRKHARPGDTLSVRFTVLECKLFHSKPGQGSARSYIEVLSQHSDVVMT
jgi:acyl dehydratase